MKREILGKDKDVIHVDEAEQKITQNLIHKVLEPVISVSKSKGHAKEFEHPKGLRWWSSGRPLKRQVPDSNPS